MKLLFFRRKKKYIRYGRMSLNPLYTYMYTDTRVLYTFMMTTETMNSSYGKETHGDRYERLWWPISVSSPAAVARRIYSEGIEKNRPTMKNKSSTLLWHFYRPWKFRIESVPSNVPHPVNIHSEIVEKFINPKNRAKSYRDQRFFLPRSHLVSKPRDSFRLPSPPKEYFFFPLFNGFYFRF